jgi:hypothetical protein
MHEIDRRTWLAGAAALAIPAASSQAAEGQAAYDYLFLDLEDGKAMSPSRAYAEAVQARLPQIQRPAARCSACSTPQIGWVARQAALLVRWGPQPRAATARSSP